MESVKSFPMMELREDSLEAVRKEYNLDKPGKMKETIDLFEAWIKKQSHFIKKDFDRDYLERLIIMGKGSLEKAKRRLDSLCTLRTLNPGFFVDVDIKDELSDFFDNIYPLTLPHLTDKHERVFFAKVTGSGFTQKMLMDAFRFTTMVMDYAVAHDYAKCAQIVMDFRNANMADLLVNQNLVDLRKMIVITIEGYGVKVVGVHFITESRWIDALVTLAKQIVPLKIRQRIFVHNDLETLYEVVQKDVFPEDYGGKAKPLSELRSDVIDTLSSKYAKELWRQNCSAKTDESLRQTDKFNDQFMGMPGSFRTLSVD